LIDYVVRVPVLWSRVHAQLGEAPTELTFAMLEAAVGQGVAEAEDLDWKARLPGREDGELDEFAKDMAAMANTSGGLIVYGVGEERGTGRANSLTKVDAAEGTQRRRLSGRYERTVRLWAVPDGAESSVLPSRGTLGGPWRCAFSPDGHPSSPPQATTGQCICGTFSAVDVTVLAESSAPLSGIPTPPCSALSAAPVSTCSPTIRDLQDH
jgi:hypothetical protein